jgi:hypothetical protein
MLVIAAAVVQVFPPGSDPARPSYEVASNKTNNSISSLPSRTTKRSVFHFARNPKENLSVQNPMELTTEKRFANS